MWLPCVVIELGRKRARLFQPGHRDFGSRNMNLHDTSIPDAGAVSITRPGRRSRGPQMKAVLQAIADSASQEATRISALAERLRAERKGDDARAIEGAAEIVAALCVMAQAAADTVASEKPARKQARKARG